MKSRIFLGIFVIAVLFTGCEKKDNQSSNKEEIKSVFVIKPKNKDDNQNRVFNGIASSNHQAKLSFKVQGNLNNLKVQIGDEIRKNELIGSLDSKPYELKVSQVNYALSEAKASLQNAKSNYERTKKLYINQNASASDIDNAKAVYDATNAKVQNVLKEFEYAKLQLSYTKLYSPIDGYISSKFVQENENVAIGTPIVLISDKVIDEVRVQVPDGYINKMKINDEVDLSFNALGSKRFKGKISEISKYASQNEKTYLVVIKIENSSDLIKSGMSADVYFNIENIEINSFLIPSNSVLSDKNGFFVYVVEDSLIKRRDVKVGTLTKEGYEVFDGLSNDDFVLKAGMSEVFENMKVFISNKKELEE